MAGAIDVTGANALTYGGIMAGTGALTKIDTGTLTLSGPNTFAGSTTVSGGVLSISADTNLGTAPSSATPGQLFLNGGTLQATASFALNSNRGGTLGAAGGAIDVTGASTLTYGGILAGAGSLAKIDAGTLTLSGPNTYTGSTTVSGGVLSVSADGNLGTAPSSATPGQLVLSGGTLQATASFALNSNRGIAVGPTIGSGAGTIDVTGVSTLTYGGIAANNGGTGVLTKTDTGTLTLSGVNTFTGGTNIQAGTLQLGANNTLPTTGPVTLGTPTSNGTLDLNGFNQTVSGLFVASGATAASQAVGNSSTSGSSTLNVAGTSTFAGIIKDTLGSGTQKVALDVASGTFTLSGSNTFSGGTSILGGTLQLGASNSLPTAGVVLFGTSTTSGTLDLNGFNQTIAGLAVAPFAAAASEVIGNSSVQRPFPP